MLPLLILVLAIVGGFLAWRRSSAPNSVSNHALSGAKDAVAVDPRSSVTGRVRHALPPRRERDVAIPPSKPSGKLVGLFDTGQLCEQHNAAHCAALREATTRCDRGDADGCRSALALVDSGPLRDTSLARLFARRLCEAGKDCARVRALEQFRTADSDPVARKAASEACTLGDAVACALAGQASSDAAESARFADLACRGGVIALGGCFELALPPGTPAAHLALSHACTSGSADGCDLLGREAFDQGDLVAARTALTRACELSPGGDGCAALDALDQQGTIDIE